MLIVSHDLGVVPVADRVAILHAGDWSRPGRRSTLSPRPQHALTRALLAASAPPPPTMAPAPTADATVLVDVRGPGGALRRPRAP